MSVRRALDTDAPAIAEVHVRSWQVAYRGLLPDALLDRLSVDGRVATWARLLRDPQLETFVAEDALGAVVGFANLAPARDADAPAQTGELTAIYVAPIRWNSGHGSALLREVLAAARRREFQRLTLWVLQSNARARRFYEAAGFTFDGTEKVETRADGLVLHECRYRRGLEPASA